MSSPLDALRRLVDAFVGARLDHLALYPARVVAQNGALLDLQPDSARVPPCAGISIRHGLPGVAVTVPVGTRVLLGFAGGDPSAPYAALWEPGEVTTVAVNGGSARAAREGDSVSVTLGTGALIPPASPGGPLPAAPLTLTGTITSGTGVLRLPDV